MSFNFMAAVTICSDFGAQENKVCHYFHYFSIYLPWDWMPWSWVLLIEVRVKQVDWCLFKYVTIYLKWVLNASWQSCCLLLPTCLISPFFLPPQSPAPLPHPHSSLKALLPDSFRKLKHQQRTFTSTSTHPSPSTFLPPP